MGEFITSHGIKLVVLLKIAVLSFILIDSNDLVQIGEKKSIAQEQQDINPDKENESDEDFIDEDDEETRRKSFFEELLTLPKIEPGKTKKDELAKYFSLIERKSRQVEDRIKLLKTKHNQLKELEKSIDNKIEKLNDEHTYFKQTQQKEKEVRDERLKSLVEFYKKMAPKKAAPVFEKLDKDLVVQLFNEIPQKQTMQILSLMNPDKSVEISEYFGRINSAKEYELLKEVNTALLQEFEKCKTAP